MTLQRFISTAFFIGVLLPCSIMLLVFLGGGWFIHFIGLFWEDAHSLVMVLYGLAWLVTLWSDVTLGIAFARGIPGTEETFLIEVKNLNKSSALLGGACFALTGRLALIAVVSLLPGEQFPSTSYGVWLIIVLCLQAITVGASGGYYSVCYPWRSDRWLTTWFDK